MRNFIEPERAPTGAQSPTTNYGGGDQPPAQASITMPPSPDRTPWLTPRLAAASINVSESTLRRLLKRGKLPFAKVGSAIRIHRNDIAAFMAGGREGRREWHL